MTLHAKLSASGAHRWMHCPGSVHAEEPFPDDGSSFAAEGTAAHELAEWVLATDQWGVMDGERCLIKYRMAAEAIGEDIRVGADTFEVTKDMAEYVQEYVDYVRSTPGELLIEKTVSFDEYVPGGFGTADAIVIGDGMAHVIDLKYGKGVRVDAERNPQAMLYGLGVLQEYGDLFDIETLKLTIHMPRLDHITEFEISADDLRKWGETEVKEAASAAVADDAPRNPGEKQCQFCKAKGTCKALADFMLEAAAGEFAEWEAEQFVDPDAISNEQLAEILAVLPFMKKWQTAMEQRGVELLYKGEAVGDFKMVSGRSTRAWGDEEKADKALARAKVAQDVRYKRSLISPTQAEKIIGKDHAIMKNHVVKSDGKPTLVPGDDPRPAIAVAVDVEQEFDEFLQ